MNSYRDEEGPEVGPHFAPSETTGRAYWNR